MKTIFILEDNPTVLFLLRSQLESAFQCQVKGFQNSQDLLDNMTLNPDLIILDYFFDNKNFENGLTVLQEIKMIDSNLPVIIFSGQHDLQLAVKLIRNGAIDYIDKNEEDFLEHILTSVRTIFNYNQTRTRLKELKADLHVQCRQFEVIGLFGLVLLITLFWTL